MEKQREDIDVVKFFIGLLPEFERVWAQILGEKELSNHAKTFSSIQCSTLSNSTTSGDHSAFSAREGSFRDGHSSQSGRGFTPRGGRDIKSIGRLENHEPQKCTHSGRIVYSLDYCRDLHSKSGLV